MKKIIFILSLIIIFISGCKQPFMNAIDSEGTQVFVPPVNSERFRLFDQNWKFQKGEFHGAESPYFNDSGWRTVDLPHDWSIEDLPAQKEDEVVGPFDKNSSGEFFTGFTIGGTGWYRKSFSIQESDLDKEISIYFDGVYMESEVRLNGHLLGYHTNGYTPFYYKLNDYLNPPDQENVITVYVKNIGDNSRWYSGSGIYRHVWLRKTNALNIPVWGVFVTTPEVSNEKAKVETKVSIENNSSENVQVILKNTILSPCGKRATSSQSKMEIAKGERKKIKHNFNLVEPELWSNESPSLYKLKSELIVDNKVVDTEETTFGIRTVSFSPEGGFLLNGKPVLLRGACIHHDNGPLGSVAFERAEQRKVAILKANGFNAIRTSHNPYSQAFMDACDRQGMLVIDEVFDVWELPKRPDDYHIFFKKWHEQDLKSVILRDRNHPSVVMWSIGNEIRERADSSGIRIAKDLIRIAKNVDSTRAITQGICEFWRTPERDWDDSTPAFDLLDVCGYNYVYDKYEEDHSKYPERVMMGTESFALDIYENWKISNKKSYVIGDFVWTGMDYIGEAGIGQVMTDSVTMCWPWIISNCGDIDLIGQKKPQSYYRDVVWDRSLLEMEVEELAPEGKEWIIRDWGWKRTHRSWNWPGNEGKKMNVYVYSKAKEVRLELNGKLVETQLAQANSQFTFNFSVPYEPGELKATAYTEGQKISKKILKTAGSVSKIRITPDRATITSNRNDLAYLTIELLDEAGILVPNSDQTVSIKVDGDAELVGVGNANPREPKSFQSNECTTFLGRCIVILRPNGNPGRATLVAKCRSIPAEKRDIEIISLEKYK